MAKSAKSPRLELHGLAEGRPCLLQRAATASLGQELYVLEEPRQPP